MKVNRLQLNTAKSEQLWCTSPRQQNRLPNITLHGPYAWRGRTLVAD